MGISKQAKKIRETKIKGYMKGKKIGIKCVKGAMIDKQLMIKRKKWEERARQGTIHYRKSCWA